MLDDLQDFIIVTILAENLILLFQVCTVHNGQNSILYYSSLIRNMIPDYIKDSELEIFKNKIQKWVSINWPCRLCRKYISNLGLINQI